MWRFGAQSYALGPSHIPRNRHGAVAACGPTMTTQSAGNIDLPLGGSPRRRTSSRSPQMRVRVGVPLVATLLFSVGCGGSGPDDPVTGTWANGSCFGDTTTPPDIQTCKLSLRFDADLKFTLIDARQSLPATAVTPRCNAIRTVTGMTYSTNSLGTLTLSGSSASTLERKDCANAADNQAAMADTRHTLAAGPISYSIKDKTLSITTGQLSGDYLRQ